MPQVASRGLQNPFFVFCTSKAYAEALYESLRHFATKYGADPNRIKLFTRDTKTLGGWHAKFQSDANKFAYQADVIIATSVIGAGFSIDKHFESFVAFLQRNILTHVAETQFTARVRYNQFPTARYVSDDDQINALRTSIMYVEKVSCAPR